VTDHDSMTRPRQRNRITALAALVALLAVVAVVALALPPRTAPGTPTTELTTAPVLGRLSTAPPPEEVRDVTRGSRADEVAFLRFIVDHVQDTWEQQFRAANLEYRRTELVVFRDTVRSGCGRASAETGPFYCPADFRVYLDTGFFQALANRFDAPGDFAVAYVIAHEFGHHVQNLLGIASEVEQASQRRPALANELSVRFELQADCLAGVWGHAAYEQARLEPGDLEEGIRAASAVGDDRLQRQATGRVDPDTFTHGTSQQRVAWFLAGFRSGDPEVCDTFQREMPAPSAGAS
jgi:uncharacterized protein